MVHTGWVDRRSAHVLVVDDDAAIRDALNMALSYEGYSVCTAVDGVEALDTIDQCAADNVQIDAMLVDLLMPRLDGLSLCRELRARGTATPILVLTALDEVGDRVAGLDAGADDYLPKPFDLAELLARVRALLRRIRTDDPNDHAGPLSVGDLLLDPVARRVTRGGLELALTTTEFNLLRVFMSNVGRVLSREYLYGQIWGAGVPATSRSLDVYVSYLRTKTEARDASRVIETVRGQGFTMREPS